MHKPATVRGRAATVTDWAELDNLARVEYEDGSSEVLLKSQVDLLEE